MIIGLTGQAGSGKDTVADMLLDYGFSKIAFASTLKAMLTAAGWPEPTREHKEAMLPGLNFTWRKAAQTLGTEWGRSLDPDLWLKIIMLKIKSNPQMNWVISDCRFPNEAYAIRHIGTLIHIKGRITTITGENASHASEQSIPIQKEDLVLYNEGTIALLAERLHALMEKYFEY